MIYVSKPYRLELEREIKRKQAELDALMIRIADESATEQDYIRRRCLEVSIESMQQRIDPKYRENYDIGIVITR